MEIQPPQIRGGVKGTVAVDPLQHPGWDELLTGCPGVSFYHGTAWARVLHETYNHRPIYECRFGSGQIEQLLPIMEVRSAWTGRRGVSLPFSDCCPALAGEGQSKEGLYAAALRTGQERGWRYLECRGKLSDWPGASGSVEFFGHAVDLKCSVESLFQGLESSVRRGVRKAESAGLKVEFAETSNAVRLYYTLHCLTRKRHGVPPQPWRFFESIGRNVLQKRKGVVGLVKDRETLVAAAVFFHHEKEAIYKFGASDYAFQKARPNNLLMWEAMKRYASAGFEQLHLGRTSTDNEGLCRFKRGLGAREEKMTYARYDFNKATFVKTVDHASSGLTRLFRLMPLPLLRLAGSLLYPHLS